ncbi:MAG: hypothetical protein KF850_26460 [Labilithrix sp.]|nr:hypothetical protein [Labilithrix sp.]MBX3215608.1 hypothetical protein [Labilithrix sp.]
MKSKPKLNMDKIATTLGAERRGKAEAGGGYFGAMQLIAQVEARFRAPSGGGRSTDPEWTERRLVPLAPKSLARLERIAESIHDKGGPVVAPLQVAALLLERATEEVNDEAIEVLAKAKAS